MNETEFSCPLCKAAFGETNRILAGQGAIQCSKFSSEHRWNDTQSFFDEKPTKEYEPKIQRNVPQVNYREFQVKLHTTVIDAFTAKFEDQVAAANTVASIMTQMVEGKIIIIGQEDLDRMRSKIGRTPESSGEVFGIMYDLYEAKLEAEEEKERAVRDLKAYEGVSPGRVVVDLGDQYSAAVERAEDAKLPLKVFAENALRNGLRDHWF